MYTVSDEIVQEAGSVNRAAVRQMAAVGQVHAEHSIARIEGGQIHGHIRLRAGMRLHIDVVCSEQLLRTVAGKILNDVDILTAAVVALAGIAFGIFIREDGAHSFHNGFTDDILRSDQLDIRLLAFQFQSHCLQHFRVALAQLFHFT
ncbi:hypothetical protein D3C71_1514930 [compost metagenome]